MWMHCKAVTVRKINGEQYIILFYWMLNEYLVLIQLEENFDNIKTRFVVHRYGKVIGFDLEKKTIWKASKYDFFFRST